MTAEPGSTVGRSLLTPQATFSNTATWLALSEVNGERSHPAQRSLRRKPAIRAMRSSSDGQA